MKLGEQEIQCLRALAELSQVEAKDVMVSDKTVSFVVNAGQMGRAIGKQGATIKKLESTFKRKVEIMEYQEKPENFVAHAFPSIRFDGFETQQSDSQHVLSARLDSENKRKLLNQLGKLRRVKIMLKRHFDISDVKI